MSEAGGGWLLELTTGWGYFDLLPILIVKYFRFFSLSLDLWPGPPLPSWGWRSDMGPVLSRNRSNVHCPTANAHDHHVRGNDSEIRSEL